MKQLVYCYLALLLLSCTENKEYEVIFRTKVIADNWEFSEEGKNEWYPATVPGSVHMDLFNNELIDDPFYENNEHKQRWIETKNWNYRNSFEVDSLNLSAQRNNLLFKGLDTYAKVYLNNEHILTASNMFRSWEVPVQDLIELGKNELRIEFESPIHHNKEAVKNYPYVLPSGNETADIKTKVSSFTRKAAYHFGWDFGPRFVTSGIWKAIYLEDWNYARITDVFTYTKSVEENVAYMETEIEIDAIETGKYELRIDGILVEKELQAGINTVKHSFEVKNPNLWTVSNEDPNYLYKQIIFLTKEGKKAFLSQTEFGIRTIELINEPDSMGTSFFFKLNGKKIFAQGANYIPQDVFLSRVTPDKYERLIQQAKTTGMNMLRVWGGGIYERDIFYELCDKHGILVWQDFMFAGSLYPESENYTENVRQVAIQNIKRLRKHPCLALWCGNNEVKVAWNNWGWQEQYDYTPEDSTEIWNYQQFLFRDLLPSLVKKYAPTLDYTPTSPLSNWGTPENFKHGSMHYWGVWHGKEPFENFKKNVGRFMVEYGFQSFPSMETLRKVMHDSSLSLTSVAMQNRQKSYIGNGLIEKHIKQYNEAPASFEEFVQLSQETQAKGLKMAIEAHQRGRPYCSGTLFWQLNDCWPGPSWSVIDYYGNEKVAYEAVKEVFYKKKNYESGNYELLILSR